MNKNSWLNSTIYFALFAFVSIEKLTAHSVQLICSNFHARTKKNLDKPKPKEVGFTFDELRIDNFLPAMLTLNVCAVGKVTGDEVPTFSLNFDQTLQFLVLKETILFSIILFGLETILPWMDNEHAIITLTLSHDSWNSHF